MIYIMFSALKSLFLPFVIIKLKVFTVE